MDAIEFGNHFKADLIYNALKDNYVARLYAPDDLYLASIECTPEEFNLAAESLMNGYFAGWRNCQFQMKKSVTDALLNVDILK